MAWLIWKDTVQPEHDRLSFDSLAHAGSARNRPIP
jgi:hypothetical protein